jgi:hypothetical protein
MTREEAEKIADGILDQTFDIATGPLGFLRAEITSALISASEIQDHLRARVAELEGKFPASGFQVAVQRELDHAYNKHGRDPWSRHELWACWSKR